MVLLQVGSRSGLYCREVSAKILCLLRQGIVLCGELPYIPIRAKITKISKISHFKTQVLGQDDEKKNTAKIRKKGIALKR